MEFGEKRVLKKILQKSKSRCVGVRALDSCLCALLLHSRRLSAAGPLRLKLARLDYGSIIGGGSPTGDAAAVGAELWGADRRRGPAAWERIGASDARWLKEKQTRGGVKEGKREERRKTG